MTKFEAIYKQFKNAIERFDEVLKKEKDAFMRDSAIKRFEFCFDLSWKLIKAFLEEKKGIICNSPKGCFREAYKQGFIEYDDFWIEMTDMRNQTSHTYNEENADTIYNQLPQTLCRFQELLKSIEKE